VAKYKLHIKQKRTKNLNMFIKKDIK